MKADVPNDHSTYCKHVKALFTFFKLVMMYQVHSLNVNSVSPEHPHLVLSCTLLVSGSSQILRQMLLPFHWSIYFRLQSISFDFPLGSQQRCAIILYSFAQLKNYMALISLCVLLMADSYTSLHHYLSNVWKSRKLMIEAGSYVKTHKKTQHLQQMQLHYFFFCQTLVYVCKLKVKLPAKHGWYQSTI